MRTTPGRHRRPTGPRRSARLLLGAVGVLIVVGVAVTLIVSGARSVPPPAAPSPTRTYDYVAAPTEPVPGDVTPPARSANATPPTPTPGGSAGNAVAATDPSAVDPVADGNETEPPRHVGPWTFEGADRLFVPTIDVEAPIDSVGSDNGAMIIPDDVRRVGRWDGGATLEASGGTVLVAGHVNFAGQGPGVLHNLFDVQPGAIVVTTDRTGNRTSWRITGLASYDKQALPAGIFTKTGPRRLVLVTCGGDLLHVDGPDGGYNTYEKNVVAQAVPAG